MKHEMKNKDGKTYITIPDVEKTLKITEEMLDFNKNNKRWMQANGKILETRILLYKQLLENGNSIPESSK